MSTAILVALNDTDKLSDKSFGKVRPRLILNSTHVYSVTT